MNRSQKATISHFFAAAAERQSAAECQSVAERQSAAERYPVAHEAIHEAYITDVTNAIAMRNAAKALLKDARARTRKAVAIADAAAK